MRSVTYFPDEPFPADASRRATAKSGRRRGAGNPNTRRDRDQRCVPHREQDACRPLRPNARRDRCRHVRRRGYPSDLTDSQWQRLQLLLSRNTGTRRAGSINVREVLDGISYRWRCGCTWRMLPHDFPPWETVYGYYRKWRRIGILSIIRDALLRRHQSQPGDRVRQTDRSLERSPHRPAGNGLRSRLPAARLATGMVISGWEQRPHSSR